MLKDKNGNFIDLAAARNGHIFLMGTSGSGKTYAEYRVAEEDMANGKKTLIIDGSNSFSEAEMRRAGFDYRDKNVGIIDVTERPISIPVLDGCNDAEKFVHMAGAVFGISGKRQNEVIRKAARISCKSVNPSLSEMVSVLNEIEDREIESGTPMFQIKRIEALIDALSPLADGDYIDLSGREGTAWDSFDVAIVQLSKLPETIRKLLSNAILRAIWLMAQSGQCPYPTIVLDEIQHIDITAPIPASIVREGRKHNLRAVMGTQFVSGLDEEARSTFFMSANILFFQPERNRISKVARLIEQEREKEWQKILRNLAVGEAVLCGKYTVNSNTEPCNTPIIVKVEKGIHMLQHHSPKKFKRKKSNIFTGGESHDDTGTRVCNHSAEGSE